MKKLAIPAILAFWLVIALVAMLFLRRPDYPPHPPEPDVIVVPGNVEVVQRDEGLALLRITSDAGQSVEYSASASMLLEYDGPISGSPYHLVWQRFEDGGEYTDLVHEGTGSTLRMTGRAASSVGGRWVASAGSHHSLGYAWVDIVELLESGPELRVHLDAVPLGLEVQSVDWTKSGDVVVTAERDYVTVCDAPEEPELVLTQDENDGWTPWLDRGRSVSVGDDGNIRVEGLEEEVDGRYVGQVRSERFSGTAYLFDPDWTASFQAAGPANPSRLLVVQANVGSEIAGWPQWAPEGDGMATSDLACGTPGQAEAGHPGPITFYRSDESGYRVTSRLLPEELGWSHGAIEWMGPSDVTVPGWVPGAAHYHGAAAQDGTGTWVPTRTGSFVQSAPDSPGFNLAVAEPVEALSVPMRAGRTAVFPSGEAPEGPFRYLGYAEELDAHLVRAGTGAAGHFILVDDVTARAWSVPAVPIPAPSGHRFATVSPSSSGFAVSVFEWSSSGGTVSMWRGDVGREEAESIYWDNDEQLWLSASQLLSVTKSSDGEWSKGVG